jgi:hypothetical protein
MIWFALLVSDILSDSLGDFGVALRVADGCPIHSLHGLSVESLDTTLKLSQTPDLITNKIGLTC